MDIQRRYGWPTLAIGLLALGHALVTWPIDRALALFVGGAAIAFAAEVIGVHLGLVEHRLEPRLLGVPVVVLLGWPATVYLALRVALLAVPFGITAAVLTATLATLGDAVLEPRGVADGAWRYPPMPVSAHRYREVPYWNVAAWYGVSIVTATLALVGA